MIETGDAHGEPVKAAAALWGEAYFDECGDGGVPDGFWIRDGVVAEDGPVFLPAGNFRGDFGLGGAGEIRELGEGCAGFAAEELEEFHARIKVGAERLGGREWVVNVKERGDGERIPGRPQ